MEAEVASTDKMIEMEVEMAVDHLEVAAMIEEALTEIDAMTVTVADLPEAVEVASIDAMTVTVTVEEMVVDL